MQSLALINDSISKLPIVKNLGSLMISNVELKCGLVEVPKPNFDAEHGINSDYVLVKVLAFSCNYRDKALILKSSQKMSGDLKHTSVPVSFFGSDFVAEVITKGSNVKKFDVGDRVIPNCAYPYSSYEGIPSGVVTNEASKGWLRLHKSKIMKIPNTMSSELAASYTIGAQTSSSMIRRINVKKDENVLVTAGRSNTSIFIIRQLLSKGIIPDVLSTSDWNESELEYIFPAKIIKIKRGQRDMESVFKKKYDVIFDPFFDLYLEKSINLLNFYGRYITCGLKNQHENFKENYDTINNLDFQSLMIRVMTNNISVIGNCIGTKEDLEHSIDMLKFDPNPIPIHKILKSSQGIEFLDLTYNLKRLGKVVLTYY